MANNLYDATPIRLPVIADVQIEDFTGATVDTYSSYMQNAMPEKHAVGSNQQLYVTQRPSFEILQDASADVSAAKGRGIYYWAETDKAYFINNDTIYANSYASSIKTISAGTEKCYFFEVGSYLVVLDPENNEGWYINTSDTVTQITDADFPSTLAHGGADLDGYLFVLDDDGVIWQSDFEDPTSWNALNYIEAAVENDGGVYLAKHIDHIIAFGARSIEFFYNAENTTGAIISRRPDLYFEIGCGQPMSVVENGIDIKFVGKTRQGALGVYVLQNFQLKKISNNSIDAYITDGVAQAELSILAGGTYAQGHNFYVMTIYNKPDAITDLNTLVYDDLAEIWTTWTTDLSEWSAFTGLPLIGWSLSTTSFTQFGQGLLINGDVCTIRTDFEPIDAFNTQYYMEDPTDYVAPDYVETYGGTGTNVPVILRIGHVDHDINNHKFVHSLEYVGDYTSEAETLTVRWSDQSDSDLNTGKSLDISARRKLTRLGKSNRRMWQLEYNGDQPLRMEAIELKARRGEV